jgi:hypothetical protein
VSRGRAPISVERIGEALGKDAGEITCLTREAQELNRLNEIFAGPGDYANGTDPGKCRWEEDDGGQRGTPDPIGPGIRPRRCEILR